MSQPQTILIHFEDDVPPRSFTGEVMSIAACDWLVRLKDVAPELYDRDIYGSLLATARLAFMGASITPELLSRCLRMSVGRPEAARIEKEMMNDE